MDAAYTEWKRRDHLICYQHWVQNPASLVVWVCISAYGINSLHNWKGSRETDVPIQITFFSHRGPCKFQQDKKAQTESISRLWGQLLKEDPGAEPTRTLVKVLQSLFSHKKQDNSCEVSQLFFPGLEKESIKVQGRGFSEESEWFHSRKMVTVRGWVGRWGTGGG